MADRPCRARCGARRCRGRPAGRDSGLHRRPKLAGVAARRRARPRRPAIPCRHPVADDRPGPAVHPARAHLGPSAAARSCLPLAARRRRTGDAHHPRRRQGARCPHQFLAASVRDRAGCVGRHRHTHLVQPFARPGTAAVHRRRADHLRLPDGRTRDAGPRCGCRVRRCQPGPQRRCQRGTCDQGLRAGTEPHPGLQPPGVRLHRARQFRCRRS